LIKLNLIQLDADITLYKLFYVRNDLNERIFAMDTSIVLYPVLACAEVIYGVIRKWVLKIIHQYMFLENIFYEYLDQLPDSGEAIVSNFAEIKIDDTYTNPIRELDENRFLNFTYYKQIYRDRQGQMKEWGMEKIIKF